MCGAEVVLWLHLRSLTAWLVDRSAGDPKAIPWTHVTPLRCGADAFFHQDVRPGDAVCWPTNMGWMMGPWLVYAALLNSATIAIFQGSPLGRPFGQFVEQARVTTLGLVPSIFKV
jgi:acyl-coenzyme A synthetase/AMP-(fatty) acid ligase